MNVLELKELIEVMEIVTKVGAPAVKDVVDIFDDNTEVTPAMVRSILEELKDPEDLFK